MGKVTSNQQISTPYPRKNVNCTSGEMRRVLLPSLNKIFKKVPESRPFRAPVPLHFGDYHNVIKKPMDLSLIRKKLLLDEYPDPWEYIDDVHLMLNNARFYNNSTSNIYQYTITVIVNKFFLTILKYLSCVKILVGRNFCL